jgi:outer membrane lipoprotein SlyB
MNYLMGALLVVALAAGPALAQDFMIYPAKGQSQDQTEKDKFACYEWAKKQSGFDPMETPRTSTPPPQKAEGSTAGGAVQGGVVGGLLGVGIGALAGGKKGAGRGALIGGLGGATIGGVRSHDQQQQAERRRQEWADREAAQYMQKRDAYNRGYSACLEAKGYTVR